MNYHKFNIYFALVDCTRCGSTAPYNKVQYWDDEVLCIACFKVLQDTLWIEEAVTTPWTIDESLSEDDWQAEFQRRRTAYRASVGA